jgi:phosphorylcholine phosphatase
MSDSSQLTFWNDAAKQQIQNAIQTAKINDDQPFAVFDADNTIWKHDLEEALLAWLENENRLQFSDLNPSNIPILPRKNETLFSYYEYLSEIDHSLCYLWACQAFEGFSLQELFLEIKKMLSTTEAIPVVVNKNGIWQNKTVPIPKIYPGQRQLIKHLMDSGIQVWVVSASPEELVRYVVSLPEYGLNIPPEQVIGVNLLLRKKQEATAGAFEREKQYKGLEHYFSPERIEYKFTSYPITPLTWYAGKVAAIKSWIHPCKRPMLVAGDSPNDFHMQFYSSGVKLRIHCSDEHKLVLEETKKNRNIVTSSDEDPYVGWLETTPASLGLPD